MSERSDDAMLDEGLAQLASGARREAQLDFWHHYWPRRVVPMIFVFTLVFSILAGVGVYVLYHHQVATDAAVSTLRQQADEAKVSGDRANAELEARGQAAVPIPQPGQAPDIEVIVSAATARVVASLPDSRPTAADLGAAVARYVAANPIQPPGPTPLQIAGGLAAYFATNPPPSGESGAPGEPGQPGNQGERGQDGHTPTTEEIQTAFVGYLRDHPDALCPSGGSFAQLRVQLSDGGSADSWQCVVATYPPPTTETTTDPPILPIPTT